MSWQAWPCFCLLIFLFSPQLIQGNTAYVQWIQRPHSNDHYLHINVPVTWSQAVSTCKKQESDLVVVRSHQELEWLEELNKGDSEMWIGLSDDDNQWQWRWIEGSRLDPLTIKWTEENPNNVEPAQECVRYMRDEREFRNFPCYTKACFVCYDGVLGMPVPFSFSGLEFHNTTKTWHEAMHICQWQGWSLVSIDNWIDKGVFDYYILHDETKCSSWWLGKNNAASDAWEWQHENEGIRLIDSEEESTYQDKNCVSVKSGNLKSVHCFRQLPFVCKKTIDSQLTRGSLFSFKYVVMSICLSAFGIMMAVLVWYLPYRHKTRFHYRGNLVQRYTNNVSELAKKIMMRGKGYYKVSPEDTGVQPKVHEQGNPQSNV